jgi:hypothetical protein
MIGVLDNWQAGSVIAGGVVVVFGGVWRGVVRPMKATADRIEAAVKWTEAQTRNNGGSTLRDAVDWCIAGIETIAEEKGITAKLPPRPKPVEKGHP